MHNKYYLAERRRTIMFNKKLLLCFGIFLLFISLSGCFFMKRVFAFDSLETKKIIINDVEITDSETIGEISTMFAKISGNKVDGITNEANYQYDFRCYDVEGHLIQYFLSDENGNLFKAGNYNDPDIFGLNFYYSGYLNYDDLQRILEIIG